MSSLLSILSTIINTIGVIFGIIIILIIIILLPLFLKNQLPKTFLYNIINSFKIVFKIIIFFLISGIIISLIYILVWLIINSLYINNSSLNQSEKIKILLNIFQLIIISIGIFVGYINYKELIRKNEGDHFPKIKIIDKSEKTEISDKLYGFILERSLVQHFTIQNISNNIIKISLNNVYIKGKEKKGIKYITKQFNYNSFKKKVYLEINNNLIYGNETKKIIIKMGTRFIEKDFKKITSMEIIIGIECYKIKKNIKIYLRNEKEYSNKSKKQIGYKFKIESIEYL